LELNAIAVYNTSFLLTVVLQLIRHLPPKKIVLKYRYNFGKERMLFSGIFQLVRSPLSQQRDHCLSVFGCLRAENNYVEIIKEAS